MLVDKCHLADIHKPTRRLKLVDDESKYSEDALQAYAWIADKMESDCIVVFDLKRERGMRANPKHPDGICLCQTGNIGNMAGTEHIPVARGIENLRRNYSDLPEEFLASLIEELEYGSTAPFSKYLIQK